MHKHSVRIAHSLTYRAGFRQPVHGHWPLSHCLAYTSHADSLHPKQDGWGHQQRPHRLWYLVALHHYKMGSMCLDGYKNSSWRQRGQLMNVFVCNLHDDVEIFRKKYLRLQICWHISDKGQSFTFFLLLCEDRYAPPWTRDLWEKVHSHLIYSHSLKTHISVSGPSKLSLGVWRPMTLIKMGWLENGGKKQRPISSAAGSQDVRDGLCGDPGPLEARSPCMNNSHTAEFRSMQQDFS